MDWWRAGFRRRSMLTGIAALGMSASLGAPVRAADACDGSGGETVRTVYGDDTIEITHQPGDGHEAIVSFTGIGLGMGGIQTAEFRKSLSGTTSDLYFVIDKTRHWYNSSVEKITDLLNADFACRAISRVVTIGNSMGGFGAIEFAARLRGCTKAISFSAQSAMDPAIVPWERRFLRFTQSVTHWNGLDATRGLRADIAYYLLFGGDDANDVRHAQRFADARCPSMSIWLVDGTEHNVAVYLRRARVLHPMIEAFLHAPNDCIDMRAIMGGVAFQTMYQPLACG